MCTLEQNYLTKQPEWWAYNKPQKSAYMVEETVLVCNAFP